MSELLFTFFQTKLVKKMLDLHGSNVKQSSVHTGGSRGSTYRRVANQGDREFEHVS